MPLDVSRRVIKTEDHVKTLIKDWLAEYYPGTWSYAPIQNGLGVHGIPDRIACVPIMVTSEMVGKTVGLFVALEAKRPGRRGTKNQGLSAHQLENLNAIDAARGAALLVDGAEDLRDFDLLVGKIRSGSR